MTLPINATLQGGKYIIKKVLGQGGFGITYLAEHTLLGADVAIKEFFMKDLNNRDEETSQVSVGSNGSRELVMRFKAKFLKEARNIYRLNHPNIVRIQDIFEENGTAYYVMEYCDGGSLLDQLKLHPNGLTEVQALTYIKQVASAVEYIHEQKMNHLDIKPGNIVLNSKGEAVLIDFGLSKQYDAETGEQTSTTPMAISHGYAPYEQSNVGGVKDFSPATDIYSIGATLFKLITGQTPPPAQELIESELPSFSASPNVVAAIKAAMQLKRTDRPQSIAAWLEILDKKVHTVDVGISSAPDEGTVPIIDPIVAERERLKKLAQEKAEREKAEAEALAKTEAERKEREEAERKKKEQEEKERKSKRNIRMGVGAFISILIVAILYFSGIFNSDRVSGDRGESGKTPEPQKVMVTKEPVDFNDGTLAYYWTGELVDGHPQGKGKIEYDMKDKDQRYIYEGNVEQGVRNDDNATLQYRNGNSYVGSFENDKFKKGRLTLKNDGVYFDGTFKDNQPWNGKWYFIQDNSLYSSVVMGKEKTNE